MSQKWRANPFPLYFLEVLSLSLLILFSIHFTSPPTNEMHIVCTFRPIPHHSWLRILIMFKLLFVYEMISISETSSPPPVSEAELWVSEYDFANDNNLRSVRIILTVTKLLLCLSICFTFSVLFALVRRYFINIYYTFRPNPETDKRVIFGHSCAEMTF